MSNKDRFAERIFSGILEGREAILRRSGCRVLSILGCDDAQAFDPVAHNVGVVSIGHSALRGERQELVSLFREKVPGITIICILRYSDKPFREADFNVPADDPALSKRTVVQASQSDHGVAQPSSQPRDGTFWRIATQIRCSPQAGI
jgi:hypothetical protein